MDISVIFLIVTLIAVWLWLIVLGMISIKYDSTLDPFQKKAQSVIVLLVPFLGAALILHLVNQHSPEAIPRSLVPWPFKWLIFGKASPSNKNRDNNEESGIDLTISNRQHNIQEHGGSTDAGGSD